MFAWLNHQLTVDATWSETRALQLSFWYRLVGLNTGRLPCSACCGMRLQLCASVIGCVSEITGQRSLPIIASVQRKLRMLSLSFERPQDAPKGSESETGYQDICFSEHLIACRLVLIYCRTAIREHYYRFNIATLTYPVLAILSCII